MPKPATQNQFMEKLRKLRDLVTPGKWFYCEIENGEFIYTDWAVSWLRWAQTQNPIVASTEAFVGEAQAIVMIELLACDIGFARTKNPSWERNFYRVTVAGGLLDGRTREVKTLREAEELLLEWAQAALD